MIRNATKSELEAAIKDPRQLKLPLTVTDSKTGERLQLLGIEPSPGGGVDPPVKDASGLVYMTPKGKLRGI